MKTLQSIIVIFIIYSLFCIRCDNPQISTLKEYEKLEYLCRIWGFLKYYHPGISNNNLNWDSVLITTIPRAINSLDKKSYNEELLYLINTLKNDENFDQKKTQQSLVSWNYHMNWTKNTDVLTNQTGVSLNSIRENKRLFDNPYVNYIKKVGNPDFSGEIEYTIDELPDFEHQLLALFRYWNIVNYFFPYKYLMDNDWDKILPLYISKLHKCKTKLDYHLLILELTAELKDSHVNTTSKTINDYWGNFELPIITDYIGEETVIINFYSDSLSKIYDLKIGDIILKIDTISINELRDQKKSFLSSSNMDIANKRINNYLFGGYCGDTVNLTIKRLGKEIMRKVKRYELGFLIGLPKGSNISKKIIWEKLEGNIGYLNLGELEIDSVEEIMKKLKSSSSLIVDLRNKPRGVLYKFVSYLVEKDTVFAKLLLPCPTFPGLYYWDSNYHVAPNEFSNRSFCGEIVVLINENTISQGEFTCMAIQTAKNVTLIGRTTAGSNGDVSIISLPGGIRTRFSGIGVYYPDYKQTQRIGIKPNIFIRKTEINLKSDVDHILSSAVKHLREE